MAEPSQLSLFTKNQKKHPKGQIIYTVPSLDVIDKYARQVCKVWSNKYGEDCTTTEYLHGFRMFVRAVVKAQVNQLNKGRSHVSKET